MNEGPPDHGRLVGALAGGLVAALVVLLMLAVGTASGGTFEVTAELLGLAFAEGPSWLGPALLAGAVLMAALVGAMLARRATDAPVTTALLAVLALLAADALWVFAWTALRIAPQGGLLEFPFLPLYVAILAPAGLLPVAIGLFLPAALAWALAVRAIVARRPPMLAGR